MQNCERTSTARSEAARLNGSKSKGPKTVSGKARSSSNSLKHGLLISSIRLRDKEDPAEFDRVFRELVKQYQPVGPVEIMLCEQLASDYWKLKRAQAVNDQVVANTTHLLESLLLKNTRTGNRKLVALSGSEFAMSTQKQIEEIQKELEALRLLHSTNEYDVIPPELEQLARDAFAGDRAFVAHLLVHSRIARQQSQSHSIADEEDEHCFSGVDLLIKEKEEELTRKLKALKKLRRREVQLAACAASIPSGEVSERIQRYETTIQRRFHRNLSVLCQLQTARERPIEGEVQE